MRTSKPIASISYNSPEFLKYKLNELIKAKKISDWMFIFHTAEEDEKKDHIHLWIKPNTLIDTMDLQEFFMEIDIKNPTKPLKCIDFQSSKTDDWILYCEHFLPYLATKNESREFCYTKDDFVFYDEDNFDELYNHAHKGSDWATRNQILQQLKNNQIRPSDLILNGTLPLNMASQLSALKYLQTHYGVLDRNGRDNHEDDE